MQSSFASPTTLPQLTFNPHARGRGYALVHGTWCSLQRARREDPAEVALARRAPPHVRDTLIAAARVVGDAECWDALQRIAVELDSRRHNEGPASLHWVPHGFGQALPARTAAEPGWEEAFNAARRAQKRKQEEEEGGVPQKEAPASRGATLFAVASSSESDSESDTTDDSEWEEIREEEEEALRALLADAGSSEDEEEAADDHEWRRSLRRGERKTLIEEAKEEQLATSSRAERRMGALRSVPTDASPRAAAAALEPGAGASAGTGVDLEACGMADFREGLVYREGLGGTVKALRIPGAESAFRAPVPTQFSDEDPRLEAWIKRARTPEDERARLIVLGQVVQDSSGRYVWAKPDGAGGQEASGAAGRDAKPSTFEQTLSDEDEGGKGKEEEEEANLSTLERMARMAREVRTLETEAQEVEAEMKAAAAGASADADEDEEAGWRLREIRDRQAALQVRLEQLFPPPATAGSVAIGVWTAAWALAYLRRHAVLGGKQAEGYVITSSGDRSRFPLDQLIPAVGAGPTKRITQDQITSLILNVASHAAMASAVLRCADDQSFLACTPAYGDRSGEEEASERGAAVARDPGVPRTGEDAVLARDPTRIHASRTASREDAPLPSVLRQTAVDTATAAAMCAASLPRRGREGEGEEVALLRTHVVAAMPTLEVRVSESLREELGPAQYAELCARAEGSPHPPGALRVGRPPPFDDGSVSRENWFAAMVRYRLLRRQRPSQYSSLRGLFLRGFLVGPAAVAYRDGSAYEGVWHDAHPATRMPGKGALPSDPLCCFIDQPLTRSIRCCSQTCCTPACAELDRRGCKTRTRCVS